MSAAYTIPGADTANAFPSLTALRAAHAALLQRRRDEGDSAPFLDAVESFVQQGQATGAILDDTNDRVSAQSLLDYWDNVLSRARRELPDATLADFDSTLAPELADDLCPYLGLDAFGETDTGRFFGRGMLIAELLAKLKDQRLLAVVGPSGSGKSSLVRAGLLPALKAGALPGSENWRYLGPMVPGSEPLANLARAEQSAVGSLNSQQSAGSSDELSSAFSLQPSAFPIVLVIDQFEETFTLCEDRNAREAFVAKLLELVEVLGAEQRVILTMRSDFETFVARFPDLQRLWERGRVQVTPMSAAEVRQAIEQPAERIGLKFETGVVDSLLADIVGEPAALPLLQFTLLRLWEERDQNRVTADAYRRVGGGRLALARAADTLYDSLIPEEQRTARRILLRMVRPGEGVEVTSSRVRRDALYRSGEDPGRIDRVLRRLIRARLVRLTAGETAADDQIEVAHEALVRNWPTLVDWLEEERAAIAIRRRLETRAQEWVRLGQGSAGLFDEIELREAERWLASSEAVDLGYDPALSALAEASRKAISAIARAKEAAARHLRWLATGLAVALVLALVATGYAFVQQRRAEDARAETERQRGIIDFQRLAFISRTLEPDAPETALLLAYEATMHNNDLVTGQALRAAIDQSPWRPLAIQGHTDAVTSAEFSPDEQRIVTASADKTVRLWDLSGKRLATLQGHTDAVNSAEFSPDGQRIVTASADKTARVWDLSGKQLATLQGHTDAVTSTRFSPDGQQIVTASADKTARVWDLSGKQLATLQGHTGIVYSARFGPDGQRIVTASADKTARVWDLSGKQLATLQGHTDAVTSAVFSPDGQRIVTVSPDTTVRVWDLRGASLATIRDHTGRVYSVEFSPDGQRIVTASDDNTARVWDLSGKQLVILQGHTSGVTSARFSLNGQRIVTASRDGTSRVWDLSGKQLAVLQGHTNFVTSAEFSLDGQRIVTASRDGTARVWDLSDTSLATLRGHTNWLSNAVFSPDGQRIVTVSRDDTARVWNLSGKQLAVLQGHTNWVNTVEFSPDGQRIVTTSRDKTARVWDLSGKQLAVLQGHTDFVTRAAFSPDGQRIVTTSRDKTARVWDLSGKQLAVLKGHTDFVTGAAFSPDGQRIVTTSRDKTARVWDLSGKQLAVLKGHTDVVNRPVFSPDGQRIATASQDKTARVWDLSGKQLAVLGGHADVVYSAEFSPDGQRIVTASADNTARVWDLSGKQLATLQGHTSIVFSAVFSPDGQRIVTASYDNTARVWDLSGTLLATLQGHTNWVNRAQFSPDGQRVVTASADGTARQYLVNTKDLLAVAACRVGRGLTQEEIDRFQVPTPLQFDFSKRQCPPKLPGQP